MTKSKEPANTEMTNKQCITSQTRIDT